MLKNKFTYSSIVLRNYNILSHLCYSQHALWYELLAFDCLAGFLYIVVG